MYEQAVWCGNGGSRHTALLIGFHRLRPANSEHQWAETDWASWVTKSHSSPSLICQKKVYFSFPRQMFSERNFEILGWKETEDGKCYVWLSVTAIVIGKSASSLCGHLQLWYVVKQPNEDYLQVYIQRYTHNWTKALISLKGSLVLRKLVTKSYQLCSSAVYSRRVRWHHQVVRNLTLEYLLLYGSFMSSCQVFILYSYCKMSCCVLASTASNDKLQNSWCNFSKHLKCVFVPPRFL